MKKFSKNTKQKKIVISAIIGLILLVGGITLYRTFALYEEKKEFNVLRGRVPIFGDYDLLLSFTIEDAEGNKEEVKTIPEGTDYDVTINCNNEATGTWNYKEWGPDIRNLNKSTTRCNINFKTGASMPLIAYGINEKIVESGTGLYKVEHSDAQITYTADETAINNLKQTEYRYAGSNPNNYVTFNNELWRIIGLVNTPEGQRIKIIRNNSIGKYSWDSSYAIEENYGSGINYGNGVNEWSQANLKDLLNSGPYYNRTSGTCYSGKNDATSTCNFSTTGLTARAKTMIDTITWNTGTPGSTINYSGSTKSMYNYERSNNTGKICVQNASIFCTDTVTRTISWKGQVGLMYPSDYGYATSSSRETCLNANLNNWGADTLSDCKNNDWLFDSNFEQNMLTPNAYSDLACSIFYMSTNGSISNHTSSYVVRATRPTLYLISNVKVTEGKGTQEDPYQLIIE